MRWENVPKICSTNEYYTLRGWSDSISNEGEVVLLCCFFFPNSVFYMCELGNLRTSTNISLLNVKVNVNLLHNWWFQSYEKKEEEVEELFPLWQAFSWAGTTSALVLCLQGWDHDNIQKLKSGPALFQSIDWKWRVDSNASTLEESVTCSSHTREHSNSLCRSDWGGNVSLGVHINFLLWNLVREVRCEFTCYVNVSVLSCKAFQSSAFFDKASHCSRGICCHRLGWCTL